MDITELSESSTPATPATLSKPTITLTAEQSRANDAVASWLADESRKPYFILHGLAGTGKTSLAKHFAEQRNSGGVVYAAYTGKAVEVLQRKGCSPAYTIHSLIYLPQNAKIKEIEELRKELSEKRSNDSLKPGEEQKIIRRIAKLNSPDFTLNEKSPLFNAKLLVLDECSMVDATIARDLIAFNVPILVLGDPGQLPPIEGAGFFNQKPDFMLTEIHRQAAESPIIQLAMKAREGRGLALGNYGSSQIIKRASVNEEHVRSVSQIITGKNTSRKSMNDEMRTLLGFSGEFPQKSERLICLRNNKQSGLFNGAMVELASDSHGVWPRNPESNKVDMTGPAPPIDMMDDAIEFEVAGREGPVTVLKDTFANYDRIRAMPYGLRAQYDEFDYAYAITCHKAQGSQFPSVLIYADLFQWDKELYKRWLYTALTRAEDRVILAM